MTQPDNSDDHAELGRIMFGEASEEEETAFLREHPDARTELSEGRTIIETLETARLVHEVQQTPPGEVPAAVLAKLEQARAEASPTSIIITPPASIWKRALRPLAAAAAVLAAASSNRKPSRSFLDSSPRTLLCASTTTRCLRPRVTKRA